MEKRQQESCSPHHAATEVGLDFFRVNIPDIQNVQLSFGAIQDPLTVQHALLKVSWLLEQLVLCGDLSQFPLKWKKEEVCKVIHQLHNTHTHTLLLPCCHNLMF